MIARDIAANVAHAVAEVTRRVAAVERTVREAVEVLAVVGRADAFDVAVVRRVDVVRVAMEAVAAEGATLAGQNLVLPVKSGQLKITYQWLP